MAIQDQLRTEGGIAAHADRHVAPLAIHDVKVVVLDQRPRLTSQVGAGAFAVITKNKPRNVGSLGTCGSASSCFRSPERASMIGIPFLAQKACKRREEVPAISRRCLSSSCESSPCRLRHQLRMPPPVCPNGKKALRTMRSTQS